MKKFIGIFLMIGALAFVAPKAKAQTTLFSLSSRYSLTLDTVTNTGVKSMTSPRITGPGQTTTITTVNTNLTGTQAGVARLYGSLDGVNYQRIRTNQLHNSQVDSLVIDANHLNYGWVVDNSPYQYYQVQTTGIGTVTFTVKGLLVKH